MNKELSQQALLEVLSYDKDSGVFRWLISGHGKSVGMIAGSLAHGYLRIKVFGRAYLAHRLAWLAVTGKMPAGQIDHKDHDKANNRWTNLRDVSGVENQHNRSISKNNKTGFDGVSFIKKEGLYQATIKVGGKNKNLGTSSSLHVAAQLRRDAEKRYFTSRPSL